MIEFFFDLIISKMTDNPDRLRHDRVPQHIGVSSLMQNGRLPELKCLRHYLHGDTCHLLLPRSLRSLF